MKRKQQLLRSLLAGLLALLLLLSAVPAIFAGQVDFDRTAAFLANNVGEPTAGDTHSDWGVFAMVRAGVRVPNGYYAAYDAVYKDRCPNAFAQQTCHRFLPYFQPTHERIRNPRAKPCLRNTEHQEHNDCENRQAQPFVGEYGI